ncbi:MAG: hypothetical protein HY077_10300 [Elusimicrobia bacterium]|nr:hypothetical protein [Elusimicrobiota bacterium]
MEGIDSERTLRRYVFLALLAFILAIVGSLQDPLPRLQPRQGAAAGHEAHGSSSGPGQKPGQEVLSKIWIQSGQPEEYKDAVSAPPLSAAALALGRFPGGAPAAGARAPRPGAALQAASAAASPGAVKARPQRPSPAPEASARTMAGPARAAGSSARAASLDEPREGPAPARTRASVKVEDKTPSPAASVSEQLWRAAALRSASAGGGESEEGAAAKARRKHRPLLRRRRMGALRPPKVKRVPTDDPWATPAPRTFPDGAPLTPVAAASLAEIEGIAPPEAETDRLSGAHWHDGGGVRWYHDGARWGRSEGGRWSWLEREEGRWWLWPKPKETVLVWHEDHWWWQSRGTWFVLHDGDAWVHRYISDWQQDGLAHPDGSRMLYNPDGSRVGLLEPSAGARFYDAQSGVELGGLEENKLPKPHRPLAPSGVTLPR